MRKMLRLVLPGGTNAWGTTAWAAGGTTAW